MVSLRADQNRSLQPRQKPEVPTRYGLHRSRLHTLQRLYTIQDDMDPIANLKEQRELAKSIANIWHNHSDLNGNLTNDQLLLIDEKAEALSELVLALDEWRSKGGFDPYKHV